MICPKSFQFDEIYYVVWTNEVNKNFANDLPMHADTQNLSSKQIS